MTTTELTVYDTAIMPDSFEGMLRQAEVLVNSGLLPAEIKTPAAAVTVMLTGRELGIPPMQAFRSIYVVKGKPTLSAQLMGALILRAGHSYRVIESSNTRCEIEFRRKNGIIYRHEFAIEDAKRAGLGGQTWQAYPKAMLFSRCMSAGARVAMPDVLAGMYTPEELADADTVILGEGGEVIDVLPKPEREDQPQPKALAAAAPAQESASGFEAWPEAKRRGFWAQAHKAGLSDDVIHVGFGVESMKEYTGTVEDARVILSALEYAVKATIGVAGLNEALGMPIAQAVAEGADVATITEAVDAYIAEKAGA